MTISQIKKAALLNFTEKGYYGASLFDIAEEVGIKKQSIYSHFKSKDELFLTVMNEVINEETNFLHQFFTHYKPDLKSYLEDLILEIKERYVNNEECNMKFVLRMAYMPPFHLKEEVIYNFKLYFLEFENLLNELFLKTKIFSVNASRATLSFMTLLDGLLVALIYGGIERFNQKFQVSWEIYWNGLLND
ncbi:TetR/AcrR family transcriptional regulator [Clostridium estertheticum]|uniref:TetR/AcrR family transcriptional regulator n=1 Tax=Clostridium estertheticum TaxID=238834 RepID=UPI001CF1E62F|nr:TetR/AcrR family transcriptional regulator [Clostridium estertheticum]MCB2309169.1 TetR/AcrR family transcriptional regulator [Clostridium estertheticum]MCB2347539.1 TetR/AcrR family transcriptional regulator [Clostridium estertheticum]MCB2352124.1 TetR/AcrR family transcriptional regulator [Clostridium estertheticum]WAG48300.1 TetR/AcrR family transcriptional regulator [Clostridium estertheticum]